VPTGFSRKELISSLKEGLPKYCKASKKLNIRWDKDFTDKNLENAYMSGTGENEKVTFMTKLLIGDRGIPFEFVEDFDESLTIKVNKKEICSINKIDGWDKDKLQAIANSILGDE